jgi:uncharacterized protein (TIGR03089 family)
MTNRDLECPGAPLLTWCDDVTGERVDLTAAELGNAAGAVAALLTDGCGLGAGRRTAVLLPPHWRTAAVLLGAWAAGIEVSYQGWATAGLTGQQDSFDASFVAAKRARSWLEEIPAAKHAFVLFGEADGYRAFEHEVAAFAAGRPPAVVLPADAAASPDGTTYREWGTIATAIARQCGFARGDRVLVDAAGHEEPVFWLLAPLSAGASVVVVANAGDIASVAAREHATHVL